MASVQQFLKSPSAYNLLGLVVAAIGLYFGVVGRLDRLDDRLAAQAVKDSAQDVAIDKLGTGLAAAKSEFSAQLNTIQRDVADTKVTLKGVETSVGWIARSFGAPTFPAAAPAPSRPAAAP